MLNFESIEPNFNIEVNKQDNKRFIITFWIDLQGFGELKYYHNAFHESQLGIKFQTDSKNIENFIRDLKKEAKKF